MNVMVYDTVDYLPWCQLVHGAVVECQRVDVTEGCNYEDIDTVKLSGDAFLLHHQFD